VGRKKYKPKLRFYVIVLLIAMILGFTLSFKNNEINKMNQGKIEMKEKKVINETKINNKDVLYISDENLYAVYRNKFTLKIPLDLYITKSKNIENLINKKKYQEVLNELNKIFPKKLDIYDKIEKEDFDFIEKEEINMPILESEQKKYINTYELSILFSNEINDNIKLAIKNNGIIDILNANGIGGYAGKTGKKLAENLGYKYNPANYEKRTDYTYIINKKLTKLQLEQIVSQMPEKNIKIKEEIGISTLADVILILGKDTGNLTYIIIEKYNRLDYANFEKLQKSGYQNLHRVKTKKEIKESKIEYNKEDYYTAYKISKKLGINLLKENNDLNNRIEIKIGGEKND